MPGIFNLKRSGTQFIFNLASAGNTQIVLASERYTSKQGAQGGIQSVKTNAPNDARYKRLVSSKGEPYFTLQGANGEVIGTSEMYSSAQARDAGIAWVKANAPTASTNDQT